MRQRDKDHETANACVLHTAPQAPLQGHLNVGELQHLLLGWGRSSLTLVLYVIDKEEDPLHDSCQGGSKGTIEVKSEVADGSPLQ